MRWINHGHREDLGRYRPATIVLGALSVHGNSVRDSDKTVAKSS
jgi:hypothetical protein